VLKSQVASNELELNSIDIMCSSIIDKYINHPKQYESLSLNFKKIKTSQTQIFRFVNYNKCKDIENWLKEQVLLYSPFRNSKNSQLKTNVTWRDAYCQQHDEIFKIKSIFNYQMPYPNAQKMDDSIDSKSKPLHSTNIWTNNINNEINYPCPRILITNTINIEQYDL
jgi:hypothetical protein